jgi:hypothetical protein
MEFSKRLALACRLVSLMAGQLVNRVHGMSGHFFPSVLGKKDPG